jgi:hypothetical protein
LGVLLFLVAAKTLKSCDRNAQHGLENSWGAHAPRVPFPAPTPETSTALDTDFQYEISAPHLVEKLFARARTTAREGARASHFQ